MDRLAWKKDTLVALVIFTPLTSICSKHEALEGSESHFTGNTGSLQTLAALAFFAFNIFVWYCTFDLRPKRHSSKGYWTWVGGCTVVLELFIDITCDSCQTLKRAFCTLDGLWSTGLKRRLLFTLFLQYYTRQFPGTVFVANPLFAERKNFQGWSEHHFKSWPNPFISVLLAHDFLF